MAWQPDDYIPLNGTYVPARYVQPQFWPPDPRDANPETPPDEALGLGSPAAAPMPQPVIVPPVQPIASPGPSVGDVLAGKAMAPTPPAPPVQPVASIQGEMTRTAPVQAAEQLLAETPRPPSPNDIAPISEVAANAELGLPPTAGQGPESTSAPVEPTEPPEAVDQQTLMQPDLGQRTYNADPMIASAERTAEAVAQAEFAAQAAQEAKQREVERIVKAREAERAKQEQSLQAARGDIDAATKAYQAQLRTQPEDRTTRDLLTILFSSLAAGLSKGRLANNAMELIQRGMENSERERVAKVASAKSEVDRVRQRYGDISADFDASESVVQQRLAAQELLYAERLKTFASQAKSVQSAEQATTMAANLEAQAQQRMAAEAEKRAEAERKNAAEAEKQRIEQEKLQLAKAKELREAKDSAAQRAQRYADIAAQRDRLAIEREKVKNEAKRNELDGQIRNLDLQKKELEIKEMVDGKTVKFPDGFSYEAPNKTAAEEVVAMEIFARNAASKIDRLLQIDANAGKEFWATDAAQEARSLYASLMADVKGDSFAQLGVITGPDMGLIEKMQGQLSTDSWISQRKSLETLRKTIMRNRNTKHAYRGQYDGKLPEIAQELDPSAAVITPEDGLAAMRTAKTATGTVRSADERLQGLATYESSLREQTGRKEPPEVYRTLLLERSNEDRAIAALNLRAKALAADDTPEATAQVDALSQEIRERTRYSRDLQGRITAYQRRLPEKERRQELQAASTIIERRNQAAEQGRRILESGSVPYEMAQRIRALRDEQGDAAALRELYRQAKERGDKKLADTTLGAIQRYESAFGD